MYPNSKVPETKELQTLHLTFLHNITIMSHGPVNTVKY